MGYSPFDIARQIGNNFAKAKQDVQEKSAIEDILSKATQSNDPMVLQQSIGQILSQVSPERQPMAINVLQNMMQNIQKRNELGLQKQALQSAGVNPNLPSALQAEQYKQAQKNQRISQALGGGGFPASTIPPQQNEDFSASIQEKIFPNGQETVKETEKAVSQPSQGLQNLSNAQILSLIGAPDREISEMAKAVWKQREKNNEIDRKERIQIHKFSESFDEELMKNSRNAKKQQESLKDIKKAINSGNVKPFSVASIGKKFGKLGSILADISINADQATIEASIPQLLEGWKQVFGVRLTDADLKLLEGKLPSIGKSKEANLAIVNLMNKYADLAQLRDNIARDVKKQYTGFRPIDYADQIEVRFDEMTKPVNVINPNNGKEISIPAYKVSEAIKAGAKLANE